jgi:hypothetical protein
MGMDKKNYKILINQALTSQCKDCTLRGRTRGNEIKRAVEEMVQL